MDLTILRPVYDREGPFATVYLEGRSPGEDAREDVRLRWKALRERLQYERTPESALNSIDAALQGAIGGEEEANGRVLVANAEELVLDAPWDAAMGTGDGAVWQELPDLGPYVREYTRAVRMLVVIADQQSARIRREVVSEGHVPREVAEEHVSGTAEEQVHKPRGQGESHRRIQRRADEAVTQNAQDIVHYLRKVVSEFQPRVLVLAGEVNGRESVRTELTDDLANILVETDRGGEGPKESDTALTDEMLRIAENVSRQATERRSEQWQAALAHELAAQGAQDVAHAAEMGAVETLLLEPNTTAKRESFLIKACSQTSSALDLVTEGTELNEGVGAILRYRMTS